ncbi:hypothetical protein [Acinetobacter beijerinckii]|jgi:hypothetical protein|uniref:hypothetical protein n=1 Tax=Acinetobacter beijerinckii TaxID=262668 RepID=UPI00300A2E4B
MLILKNIFVFIISVISISLLIVVFDKFGMNKNFNLLFSSMLYGFFITLYFKNTIYCLILLFTFYLLLFLLKKSIEVYMMLLSSILTFSAIKLVMPKLKSTIVTPFYKSDCPF